MEQTQGILAAEFEAMLAEKDVAKLHAFLDDQNISEVAELVEHYPDENTTIIASMSTHRAASVFKILDLSSQKSIIRKLPANTTALLS